MTAIPYGLSGVMFGLREDHDDEYGDCVCSPLSLGWAWQRGCPTTDLPAAPLWRPHSAEGSTAADSVDRARRAVAALVEDRAASEAARSAQLARWQAEGQAADLGQRENAADGGRLRLAADGGAP